MMSHIHAMSYYLGAFVDELARGGVQDVVISPGSRSTPLALLFAEHTSIQSYLHVDERSAAFFALGIAKAKKRPVALLCTSGTAAANYFPAVTEAYHSRVPLLVLTADRPHELRDVGAPQAMNQMNLFGSFAKTFIEMALPEETLCSYARATATRAIAAAAHAPAGPVHVNFPLREPLLPDLTLSDLWDRGSRSFAYTIVEEGVRHADEIALAQLYGKLLETEKGLIVVGDNNNDELAWAVTMLAERLQYPVLADPLSGLRSGSHDTSYVLDCYDTFLRTWGKKPDVVIRLGAMPVSKALTQYLKKHDDAWQIVVDPGAGWRDPVLTAAQMVYMDEVAFCRALTETKRTETVWMQTWRHINAFTKKHLQTVQTYDEMFEGRVITDMMKVLPEHATLFVSNSMPVRDADTFAFTNEKNITIAANRGINGIDGIISTALGMSTVQKPLVLITGDLAFYHDMNGLLAAKLYGLHAIIVVVNNDGGGIFSFLPQYGEKKHFEALFGTPIGLDYAHAAAMYGATFERPSSWKEFAAAIHKGLANEGLHIVEVRTDREENLRMHRSLWHTISEAIEAEYGHEN
ncbi:2-succinyl-5-enolpyruvyl-6-hydroxy-3-cyclohexene-1-carboxylic-acid synthase [Ectobacillus antri]|uniref:2-succinyl-5-enolpyruvyl-6-hydroxy-3-cyclohexene-1-carboxylate synthase n=1 Tax=Ectobacillus antri TaxID=2486280 RepID=A0ABT6H4W6_9BACI|nr:2-succinyl-5-enolpyruvyl-6-hydroxy-3-cyclohexene-1-carboxylic-acid synthase [Ectobacillus antri]MDG4656426.1 2-succinyl-5-enolpyruvyl-6-hydroxy-3-cyclohexene-1-carboxylic-acid synthase [Ectobacillus antri]MDG5753476.1 2-succinyl-5-enolpyruvyl-6-hydroxy-3-cyclohexene-1-carboxylic-acid synthase [Ectobacillus antri]